MIKHCVMPMQMMAISTQLLTAVLAEAGLQVAITIVTAKTLTSHLLIKTTLIAKGTLYSHQHAQKVIILTLLTLKLREIAAFVVVADRQEMIISIEDVLTETTEMKIRSVVTVIRILST